jgi:hypothetical protein
MTLYARCPRLSIRNRSFLSKTNKTGERVSVELNVPVATDQEISKFVDTSVFCDWFQAEIKTLK